jgi:hypothetical protein
VREGTERGKSSLALWCLEDNVYLWKQPAILHLGHIQLYHLPDFEVTQARKHLDVQDHEFLRQARRKVLVIHTIDE